MDALYSRKEKGAVFRDAVAEVAERSEKRAALFEDPAFRNRLGHVPDQYTLMRGSDPNFNIEQSMFMKNPTLLPGILMVAAVALAGLTWHFSTKRERDRYQKTQVDKRVEGTSYLGTPRIGGDFELTDCRTGKPFRTADYRGKWLYVYFGFTNCPDICPAEVVKLGRVTNRMQEALGDAFVPVMITVDPVRDGPEELREYLSDQHPDIIGLTGTKEEIDKVCRQFRVYFAVPDVDTFTADDYLVDHSIITYLINPHGQLADYTTREYSAREAADQCKKAVGKWEDEMVRRGHQGAPNTPIVGKVALHPEMGMYHITQQHPLLTPSAEEQKLQRAQEAAAAQ